MAEVLVQLAVGITPLVLGFVGREIRQFRKDFERTAEKVEDHEDALYGDGRLERDDGIVGVVEEVENKLLAEERDG